MHQPTLAALAVACALTLGLRAEIDPKNFDTSIKPQDDFYRYANGAWLKNNPVPPEFPSWGGFSQLAEESSQFLRLRRGSLAAAKLQIVRLERGLQASEQDCRRMEALRR